MGDGESRGAGQLVSKLATGNGSRLPKVDQWSLNTSIGFEFGVGLGLFEIIYPFVHAILIRQSSHRRLIIIHESAFCP